MKRITGIAALMMVLSVMVIYTTVWAESQLQVEEAVVCEDVVDRVPVGAGDVFPNTQSRLYCFSRVTGATSDTEITHNWYYDGKMMASVALSVKTPNYRTYSSKRILPDQTGEWMVEILSEDGIPLTRLVFSVQ